MPEGHTIHRLGRDLAADLKGRRVPASSPQGRFADGAARLDGATMTAAEAWGKHLFCHWDTGDVLHVHLGLIGKFRPGPLDDPGGDTVRLRLEGHQRAWQLTGPQTCAVITPEEDEETAAGNDEPVDAEVVEAEEAAPEEKEE